MQQCCVWRPKHILLGFICGQVTSGVDTLCDMHCIMLHHHCCGRLGGTKSVGMGNREEEGGGVRSGSGVTRTILLSLPLVLVPLNSLVWYVPSSRYTLCLGWRMHCCIEVTESSTNKQHHLSASTNLFAWGGGMLEEMCYERLRAEACVDKSAHHVSFAPTH